jgi:hypothetical protein
VRSGIKATPNNSKINISRRDLAGNEQNVF